MAICGAARLHDMSRGIGTACFGHRKRDQELAD